MTEPDIVKRLRETHSENYGLLHEAAADEIERLRAENKRLRDVLDPEETMPKRSKDFMRENEVADGINIIIDDRFVAMFPMECRAQVEHLVRSVNLAVAQKLAASNNE